MNKLCVLISIFVFYVYAEVPTFKEIGTLEDIGVKAYDAPNNMQLCFPYITFADWDGDGKKDVLLGGVDYLATGSGGKVFFFKNTSATGNTQFDGGVAVKAGGVDIAFNAN